MTSTTTNSFTITAAPGTDIWRKPPVANVFNAPTSQAGISPTTGPLLSFLSAKLSFSFAWTEQYDQAGILLSFLPLNSPPSSDSKSNVSPPKWIKTGVELYNGQPMLSTVSCDKYADWSVAPLSPSTSTSRSGKTWTTITVEKATDEHGVSLWVYRVLEDGTKIALREICWVYQEGAEDWQLEVLAMAARPNKEATTSLEVEIKDFEVKWTA
ncbi:hypothetical protein B0H63DRAFT_463153 [Podospora didyma]|uniref:Uncharacterized protein n=1 Tax=Podospora didyma TaxID=330526 RepID=A0AAE0NWU8_9PEZI|nr:hypothetical protein B0H63DRAFT_463153 [Podospora didyma]